jgi:hypothetical protein
MYRFLFVVFLFSASILSAQKNVFTVDCGRDTMFCLGIGAYIGSQVKLTNGSPPYQYTWNCNPRKVSSNLTFTASDYLNDTTLLNPFLKGIGLQNKPWRFYLKVVDGNDNISIDSIDIQCSTFSIKTYVINLTLTAGDSVQFHNDVLVGGGIPPVKYYWTPGIGLDDSTRIDAWCKPKKTTSYLQYIIDSAGCKSDPNLGINVRVITTEIENKSINSGLCMRQLERKLFFNNHQGQIATISFYATDGRILLTSQTQDSFYNIPRFESSGCVICKLEIGKRKETIRIY